MGRSQLIAVGVFGLLFALLYFGCDVKSPETRAVEKSRALNFETVSIPSVRKSMIEKLDEPEKQELDYLEQTVRVATEDSIKSKSYEQISSFWYANGSPLLAGHFAQKIAEDREDVDSWAIAGSTYFICAKSNEDQDEKTYCLNNAIQAFETAVSMNPDDIDQKINLALCYVDFPPEENPMSGIQQLLTIQRENPENSSVQIQLARLGIQTGQWEKAIARLEDVLAREPNNTKACCYIAQAYDGSGQSAKAESFKACCEQK